MFRKCLALLAAGLLAAPAFAGGELGLGDAAPAINVKWVKGDPVAALSVEDTYVVEFWATWCGPCKKSIPHLTELQSRYGDKVTFIGVSVWEDDQSLVEPFVKEWGDKMGYRVAMDMVEEDKGRMAQDWMKASGARGIPTAFIVDKGKIAWIGHPMQMDEPLAAVVAGEWNLEEAVATRKKEQEGEKLYMAVQKAASQGKWEEALGAIDKLLASQPEMEGYIGHTRFMALMGLGKFEKASAYGKKFLEGVGKDNAQALNALAWTIVDPSAKHEKRDLQLALTIATRASDLTENKEPAILDTLARVYYEMGDVAKAIEIQGKAVELSKGTNWEKDLTKTLDEYKGAAKS